MAKQESDIDHFAIGPKIWYLECPMLKVPQVEHCFSLLHKYTSISKSLFYLFLVPTLSIATKPAIKSNIHYCMHLFPTSYKYDINKKNDFRKFKFKNNTQNIIIIPQFCFQLNKTIRGILERRKTLWQMS